MKTCTKERYKAVKCIILSQPFSQQTGLIHTAVEGELRPTAW